MARPTKKRKRPDKQTERVNQPAVDPLPATTDSKSTISKPPVLRPALRHPKLLAALIILLVIWLAFLVYLAIRVNS